LVEPVRSVGPRKVGVNGDQDGRERVARFMETDRLQSAPFQAVRARRQTFYGWNGVSALEPKKACKQSASCRTIESAPGPN